MGPSVCPKVGEGGGRDLTALFKEEAGGGALRGRGGDGGRGRRLAAGACHEEAEYKRSEQVPECQDTLEATGDRPKDDALVEEEAEATGLANNTAGRGGWGGRSLERDVEEERHDREDEETVEEGGGQDTNRGDCGGEEIREGILVHARGQGRRAQQSGKERRQVGADEGVATCEVEVGVLRRAEEALRQEGRGHDELGGGGGGGEEGRARTLTGRRRA